MNRRHFVTSGLMLMGGLALAVPLPVAIRSKIVLRFAVASDGHYGQPGTEFDRFHDEMMRWLNDEHKKSPLNFCVFNGDLIHDDISFFPEVKKKYETLKFPYHLSRGNHDPCDQDTWRNAWGRNLNYTFEVNDNAFVILDTSNEKGEYLCPKMSWIETELQSLRRHKHVFIFMHIPPVLWNESFADCKEVVEMFSRQENLRAVFHGHDHQADDARFEQGKPYIFDGHIGGNWGTAYRGYRIVEVYSNGQILTYQVNPARRIKVNENKLS